MPRPRKPASPFRYFNSSPEVIRLVVMMYVRFPLSLRNVEDLLAERGIDICHETVRLWWNQFGPLFAADVRRQRCSRMRGFRQWKWHLDEVYVKINGEMHYLWRAVDEEGKVLESYVTKTRDKAAALKFIKKALKRNGSPKAITTDGLRSYKAAITDLGNTDKQEVGRWANNRVENSHLAYDKRGSGASQGNGDAAGFGVLASDAVAAMRFMQTLPEVAPGKVGFAGSSQAGWVVAKAIADGAAPADVFLLGAAGTAFTVREQNLYNTEVRMSCAGIAKPLREMALQQQRAFFDALAKKSAIPRLDALTRVAEKEPAIRDWLFPHSSGLNERGTWFTVLDSAFDPLPIWKRYRGKAVFVFSEFDDATDTRAALRRLRGARAEVEVLHGAQHLGLKAASLCGGDLGSRTSFAPPLFAYLDAFARRAN